MTDALTSQTLGAIHVCGLKKHYKDTRAADGIDLDVPRGMIFAILGPNGAGKHAEGFPRE